MESDDDIGLDIGSLEINDEEPSPSSITYKSDEEIWKAQSLEDKCRDVIFALKEGKRRWDSDNGENSTEIPVLEKYRKESMTGRDEREKTAPTILHILAKKKDWNVPPEILAPIAQYILEHQYAHTPLPRPKEEPILKVAASFDNKHFINCLRTCLKDRFRKLLEEKDSDGANCLHFIFRESKPYIPAVALYASGEALAATDNEGNTPLHYAMDYRLCRSKGEYGTLVRMMVSRADEAMKRTDGLNKNRESPYLYYQRTRSEYLKERSGRRQGQAEAAKQGIPSHQSYTNQLEDKTVWITRYTASIERKGFRPTPPIPFPRDNAAPKVVDSQPIAPISRKQTVHRGNLVKAPKDLRHDPFPTPEGQQAEPVENAISNPKPNAETKPQIEPKAQGQAMGGKLQAGKLNEDRDEAAERIAAELKLHYIRTRSDQEAQALIYGKVSLDVYLYFDASHYQGESAEQINSLIDRLSRAGSFDNTLSYVRLPTVRHGPAKESVSRVTKSYAMNQGRSRDTHPDNSAPGHNALIAVFDKLYEANVRRVIHLQVNDMDHTSHTDAAIEEAVCGIQLFASKSNRRRRSIAVEIWDWRKLDLDIDVIKHAAPDVQHVHLYWNGNATVLKAWACEQGIPMLRQNKGKLAKVTLHVIQRLETQDRTDKVIEQFVDDIKKSTKNEVEVAVLLRHNNPSKQNLDDIASGTFPDRAEGPQQHQWVDSMEYFRHTLINMHRTFLDKDWTFEPSRAKVALIDDGVNFTKIDSYRLDAKNEVVDIKGLGYSYRPWYESDHGHGTIMANMILRINPWAELYIMKIRSNQSASGRNIYAESAANAILSAVDHEVDIISISWTIKVMATEGPTETTEVDGINKLRNAIDKAKESKIIIFCSASDDFTADSKDYLPFAQASDYIFRIGAADAFGQRGSAIEDIPRISYYFPGNQVAEPWNPRSAKTVKYHNGSSVATALAAGLASLLLSCTTMVKEYHKNDEKERDRERWSKINAAIRKRDNLRRAFDNIDSPSWPDKKYLPVWDMFGNAAKRINSTMDKGGSIEDMFAEFEALVSKLCNKVE